VIADSPEVGGKMEIVIGKLNEPGYRKLGANWCNPYTYTFTAPGLLSIIIFIIGCVLGDTLFT